VSTTRSALSTQPTPPSRSRPGYVDVDRLRNSQNIVAVISQRPTSGVLTFAIFREFERDGRTERSSIVPESMMAAYEEMVGLAKQRMKDLRTSGSLPFPVPRDP